MLHLPCVCCVLRLSSLSLFFFFFFNDTATTEIYTLSLHDALPIFTWADSGLKELKKIPFFVRGKVKRNTEKFARDLGLSEITVDTLYEAKARIGK